MVAKTQSIFSFPIWVETTGNNQHKRQWVAPDKGRRQTCTSARYKHLPGVKWTLGGGKGMVLKWYLVADICWYSINPNRNEQEKTLEKYQEWVS